MLKSQQKNFKLIFFKSKLEAAAFQSSPNHEQRWVTLYLQMGRLNLDSSGRQKMEIFVNGRENEGETNYPSHFGNPGKTQARRITRRDMTRQAYRFGDDYYKPVNDMIKLESARCPLKEQNEGYLMNLLATYWKDAARVLKFENKGEIENGKFKFSKSRAHNSLENYAKEVGIEVDEETYAKIAKSVEDLHNKPSHGHKIRGMQGWERDANQTLNFADCPRQKAVEEYSDAIKNVLLSRKQQYKVKPKNLVYKKNRVIPEISPTLARKKAARKEKLNKLAYEDWLADSLEFIKQGEKPPQNPNHPESAYNGPGLDKITKIFLQGEESLTGRERPFEKRKNKI